MLREKIQYLACGTILVAIFALFPLSVDARNLGVVINGGRSSTDLRKVTLRFTGPNDVEDMWISTHPKLKTGGWEPFRSEKTWYLEYGDEHEGQFHDIYVKFRDEDGNETSIYEDSIRLDPPAPEAEVKVITDQPLRTRFVTLEFREVSDGIDAYRVGFNSDLSGVPFQIFQERVEAIVSAGEGNKTIYIDLKNSDGEILRKTVTVTYDEPGRSIAEGSLVKGTGPSIYYYGYDGYLHPYVDADTYNSWYRSFDGITQISDTLLRQQRFGAPLCMRQGTWLLKFRNFPKVYAIERGCVLRPIRSEVEAFVLYGADWGKRVREYDDVYRSLYYIKNFQLEENFDITDEDKDGLSEDEEDDWGSSDEKEDTDGDGISDYEEIRFWLTDPALRDSDGDGVTDGAEIQQKRNPLGGGALSRIPSNTYFHPNGSLIRSNTGLLYYMDYTGRIKKVTANTLSSVFTSNHFRTEFIIQTPVPMWLPAVNGSIKASNNEIRLPLFRRTDGSMYFL